MKNLLMGLILAGTCSIIHTGLAEEALVWQFEDPNIKGIGGSTLKAADVVDAATGNHANAIRVKAIDGDSSSYLKLYAGDGAQFIELGSALAMPSEDGWFLEPLFAGLGENYSKAGVQFLVELGYYSSSGDWSMLAYGTATDYGELVSDYIQDMATSGIPALAWNGGSYVVPEPTSGMLLLWGLAALGLRRKSKC